MTHRQLVVRESNSQHQLSVVRKDLSYCTTYRLIALDFDALSASSVEKHKQTL